MSPDTTPRRRYDASRRREQAAATRHRIVEAAAELFVERGYAGTTIPAIAAGAGVAVETVYRSAAGAGVAVETVYRSAAGKAGLLAAAVQAALAGGVERSERPVEQREGIRRVIEEPDPRRQLAAYAHTQPGLWSRVGPLLRVLDSAASSDPALQRLQAELATQRLDGMRRLADFLDGQGRLRPGLPAARAADLVWTLCAQANFDALVGQRGWTHREYEAWLADMLAAALLPE